MRWFLVMIATLALASACPGRDPNDPPVNTCGNGALDPGEECDGAELNQWSCYEAGFDHGEIRCGSDCKLDTSGCVSDPCWRYPCASYGRAVGEVIEDFYFDAANEAAYQFTGGDDYLDMHDLYLQNEAHGGTLRGVLFFVSAGWCPVCSVEAPKLEALYQELRDQGILIIGVISEDGQGSPADPDYAAGYAQSKDWTFPAVSGRLNDGYWPDQDLAGAFPFNMFVDLRDMRQYGAYISYLSPKVARFVFGELVAGPRYDSDGARIFDFDCAPGSADNEPNDYQHLIDGDTLPFGLSGVLCPPTLAADLKTDEDVVDLGTLQAGTVIDVVMSRPTNSPTYPIFMLLRDDDSGWYQWAPGLLDAPLAGRQWVIDTAGRYVLSAFEGHIATGWYYPSDEWPTEEQECCEGGPDYTYSLAISSFNLAANEAPLVIGQTRTGTMDTRDLRVFPFAASATVSHTFTLETSSDFLDPYLLLYDPATSTSAHILAFNDDIDTANGNTNSRIVWTATTSQTIWVVVSYFSVWVRGTTPGYRLTVQ